MNIYIQIDSKNTHTYKKFHSMKGLNIVDTQVCYNRIITQLFCTERREWISRELSFSQIQMHTRDLIHSNSFPYKKDTTSILNSSLWWNERI